MAELIVEGTKDDSLASYFENFRAMATTMTELRRETHRVDVLKGSLAVWSNIRKSCESIAALERQVDDIPELITHLHTIGDYLEMNGFAIVRVAVLRLITEIDELYSDKSSPDDIVLGFTHLGVQWLQLGYSGKAGLAFDRARTYKQQHGVTAFASLDWHISYCRYLLAVGNLEKM